MREHKVSHNGEDVICYGLLEDTSNFQVVCEDEEDDDVWCDSVPGVLTWESVVAHLSRYFASRIIEISAV